MCVSCRRCRLPSCVCGRVSGGWLIVCVCVPVCVCFCLSVCLRVHVSVCASAVVVALVPLCFATILNDSPSPHRRFLVVPVSAVSLGPANAIAVAGSPVVSTLHNAVYVVTKGSPKGTIAAIPLLPHHKCESSTTVRWTQYISGTPVASPALSDDQHTLYVGSKTGVILALNAATGTLLWSLGLENSAPVSSSLRVDGGASGRDTVALQSTCAYSTVGLRRHCRAPGVLLHAGRRLGHVRCEHHGTSRVHPLPHARPTHARACRGGWHGVHGGRQPGTCLCRPWLCVAVRFEPPRVSCSHTLLCGCTHQNVYAVAASGSDCAGNNPQAQCDFCATWRTDTALDALPAAEPAFDAASSTLLIPGLPVRSNQPPQLFSLTTSAPNPGNTSQTVAPLTSTSPLTSSAAIVTTNGKVLQSLRRGVR